MASLKRWVFDRLAGLRHSRLYWPDWLLGRVQDKKPIGPNPHAQPWQFDWLYSLGFGGKVFVSIIRFCKNPLDPYAA